MFPAARFELKKERVERGERTQGVVEEEETRDEEQNTPRWSVCVVDETRRARHTRRGCFFRVSSCTIEFDIVNEIPQVMS